MNLRDEIVLAPLALGLVILSAGISMGPAGAVILGVTAFAATVAALVAGPDPERPTPVWARLVVAALGCLALPFVGAGIAVSAAWFWGVRLGEGWWFVGGIFFLAGALASWVNLVLTVLSGGWRIWAPLAIFTALLVAASLLAVLD